GTGNVCSTDYQCLGGQKCHSEVCECEGNEVILGGRCVKNDGFCLQGEQNRCYNLSKPGQNCQLDAQCIGGSDCMNAECKCPPKTTLINDVCKPTTTTTSICQFGQIFANGSCLNLVAPGDACVENAQCVDGASCTNAFCMCPEGLNHIDGYCRKLTFTDRCNEAESVSTVALTFVCSNTPFDDLTGRCYPP
ncbi:unnamed protein product, partial [Anisakis simplex]|uniref:EB domain-containing protein n=1 Tax=Anisakis simplex TaxID=6269 RepID=A0A0M3KFF5_ANISI